MTYHVSKIRSTSPADSFEPTSTPICTSSELDHPTENKTEQSLGDFPANIQHDPFADLYGQSRHASQSPSRLMIPLPASPRSSSGSDAMDLLLQAVSQASALEELADQAARRALSIPSPGSSTFSRKTSPLIPSPLSQSEQTAPNAIASSSTSPQSSSTQFGKDTNIDTREKRKRTVESSRKLRESMARKACRSVVKGMKEKGGAVGMWHPEIIKGPDTRDGTSEGSAEGEIIIVDGKDEMVEVKKGSRVDKGKGREVADTVMSSLVDKGRKRTGERFKATPTKAEKGQIYNEDDQTSSSEINVEITPIRKSTRPPKPRVLDDSPLPIRSRTEKKPPERRIESEAEPDVRPDRTAMHKEDQPSRPGRATRSKRATTIPNPPSEIFTTTSQARPSLVALPMRVPAPHPFYPPTTASVPAGPFEAIRSSHVISPHPRTPTPTPPLRKYKGWVYIPEDALSTTSNASSDTEGEEESSDQALGRRKRTRRAAPPAGALAEPGKRGRTGAEEPVKAMVSTARVVSAKPGTREAKHGIGSKRDVKRDGLRMVVDPLAEVGHRHQPGSGVTAGEDPVGKRARGGSRTSKSAGR